MQQRTLKTIAGAVLRSFNLYEFISEKIDFIRSYFLIPKNATILIHIGKCGGSSLRSGIKHARQNKDVYVVHAKRPVFRKDLKYIIVAREPISRVISAFRWRQRLISSEDDQKNRFVGEYDVLIRYDSINDLAESLYLSSGEANNIVQKEARTIHHIREDISFHLYDLLNKCSPEQIIAVLMQENLDNDIFHVFGYRNDIRENNNQTDKDEEICLSKQGVQNLRRFLQKDYESLIKLYSWGKIEPDIFVKILYK